MEFIVQTLAEVLAIFFLTDLDSLIDKSKEFTLNVKDCSYNSIDIEFFLQTCGIFIMRTLIFSEVVVSALYPTAGN